MPLNEADKSWVRERIREANERRGWAKVTGFLKDWIVILAAAGVVVFVLTQWNDYVEFRTRTRDRLDLMENTDFPTVNKRLDTIEGTLQKLSAIIAARQMERYAALSKQDFQSTLPELKSVIQLARQEKVKAPSGVIDSLQHRFLEGKNDAPEFWQTASTFINYRSFNAATGETAGLPDVNLKNCTDSKPNPFRVTEVSPVGSVTKIASPYYERCRFTLDSAEDDARINSMIADGFPVIEFRNCLIVYKGGSFTLITNIHRLNVPTSPLASGGHGLKLDFNGPTLWFTDCLIDFSLPNQILEPVKEITETLLSQTGHSLALPVGNSKSAIPPTHN